jgi:hypothetical protein
MVCLFYSLEQLHILPNVNYLAKVRNSTSLTGVHEENEHKEEGKKEEKAHA